MADIRSRDFLVNVGHSSGAGGLYFRDRAIHRGVSYEHTLYTKTTDLYAFSAYPGKGDAGTPPRPPFAFRPAGAPLPSTAVDTGGLTVTFSAVDAQFRWNVATSSWDRTQDGTPHVDQAGALVSPENVVVLFVPYGQSMADARTPEARPFGQGEAWVLT